MLKATGLISRSFDNRTLAKILAGVVLGGITVVMTLSALKGSESATQSAEEPSADRSPSPKVPEPEVEPDWTLGDVSLNLDGIDICGLTHVGKGRSNNQDTYRLIALPDLGSDYALLLVCDGMGGHAGGEVASELAANLISNVVRRQKDNQPAGLYETLSEALHRADAAINQRASKDRELTGMGTTAIAAVLCLEGYVHCYIGDSRLYQTDGRQINYVTRDHSVVRLLLEEGIINESEAKDHPFRSRLTSSLGGGKEANHLSVDPKWDSDRHPFRKWQRGDWLLLCSDGLNSELTDSEIEEVLRESRTASEAAHSLLDKTLRTDARDNVTLIVARRP